MKGRLEVLYIDDDAGLLELGRQFLESGGQFSVTTLTSAPAALDRLKSTQFDAIIADYMMPGMTGIEFLRNLRASGKTTPVILFTGRGDEESAIQALNAGAVYYLKKDGEVPALFAQLAHVIQQSVLLRQAMRDLADQEQRYQDIQNANDLIQSVTPDGHFLFVNNKWLDTLGYRPGDLSDLTIFDIIHEESLSHCKETFGQVMAGENVGIISATFRTRDGRKVFVEGMATCRLEDGKPAFTRGIFKDVTERRLAQAAEEERKQTFEALVEQSSEGIIIVDFYGMLLFANPRAWDIVEYPAELRKAEKFNIIEIVAPEQRVSAVRDFLRVSWGTDRFPVSYRIITYQKNERWLECIGKKISFQGKPAMLLSFRDATERRSMELVLKENEEKFRTIFEYSPYPIAINSMPDYTFLAVNAEFLKISGYAKDEVLGKNPVELGLLTYVDAVRLISRRVLAGRIENTPLVLRGKDGRRIHVLFSTIPVTINDKQAVLTVTVETTNLRRIEEELLQKNEELRASEEKYRTLVETTSDFIWEVDENGVYTYASPKVKDLLGYDPAGLIGKRPFDFMPPEEADRVGAEFLRCVGARLPISALENRNVRKDGSIVILETSGIPRYDEHSRFLGYRGIDRDITERRQLESAFQAIVSSMVGTTGMEALDRITENVASWLKADCVMVGEIQPEGERVKVLSMILDGSHVTDFSYTLKGSPCENVTDKGYCIYPDHAVSLFPTAKDMVELNIQGYVGTPLRNVEGGVIGILCVLTRRPLGAPPNLREIMDLIAVKAAAEIERKNALQALRESEERFRTILNSAQAGIIVFDATTHTVIDINPKALALIGAARDEVIGSVCHKHICPAEAGRCPVTDLNQTIDTSERILLSADGREIPVLKTVVCANIGGKEVLVESFIDITGLKQAEASLRESEQKLSEAMDLAQLANWEYDVEAGAFIFDDRYFAMFGTTAEREGGNRMPAVVYAREFIHPEDRAVLQEEMEKARDAPGPHYVAQREHRIIRRDGEIRYIAVRIEVTKDAQGRIIKARGVNQDITERKRAEEALKESEERFRMLLQHVPSVAVQGYAMDGTTQYWNEASEKLYGYTAEEAIGKNLVDLIIPPEMRDDVRGAIRYMAETGLPIPASELSLMRKDGSRVALYSSHAIVRRSSGALELFCIDIDLSDRKRAEEALVDEMTKRKILIDQSRDGIVTLDESGKVYEANRRFAEMLGYTPEEMRELYVWDWDYQFSREQILGMIRTISAEGAHFESRHRRKDGSVIDVELSNNAATFSGKKLVFCVVRDITERKRMQDAVRESEEHYRSLAENVHDGIFIYQGNRFIFVNSLICKLTGYPKEELLAMDFFDLVHPDDRAEVQKNAERRARGEQVPDIYELRVVRKDGAVRYAELALSIILMKGGYAVLGAGRDITERRQAEEALRQANRKLTMLNSITRHDILNQLTALLGYLEFSKEDITDPAILEYVEKEDQAAKAIRSQIEFSRNYQDIGTQEPRWQLLPEVIGAGIRQLQPKGVAIDVDCAGVEVFADPLLEKVFYNLMENSRRHGEHVTRMKFACRETADGLVVTYTDDGVGISAKDKKNLFKRGFGKHTGLGLFLSQEILAITGITIAENGEPGTGVRFGITVPDGKWRRAQAG